MLKRGSIYLAKLYPSKGHEVGKTRPVLVLQSDLLNSVEHTTIIILPLSTQNVLDSYPLRFHINARDKLQHNSDILCDQIRAIDIHRIIPSVITSLNEKELYEVQQRVEILLDFNL